MRRRQLLVWVFGLPLGIISIRGDVYSAAKTPLTSSAIGSPTQEEYAVWTSAIKNVIEASRPPEMIVINDETGDPPSGSEFDLVRLLDSRPKLSPGGYTDAWIALKAELLAETLADFEQKNQSAESLLNKFHLPLRIQTINDRELSQLGTGASEHFWQTLRERYPHAIGLFRVSRIGFSSDKTQAIVYIEYQSGTVGGDGRYVLLRKENGSWKCRAVGMAWIS